MSEGEFWRCECGATSLADADAMPTRRRDIDGVAHRTANGGGCNVPVADRDATIAQLREDIKEWRRLSDGFEAQRDSLAASLEATKPCEPCQRDDHDNCTGDCSSMCCALADAERERDSALADLAALRGRVAEAMDAENRQNHHLAAIRSVVVEFKAAGEYEFRAETAAEAFLQQKIRALLDDLYEELGMN